MFDADRFADVYTKLNNLTNCTNEPNFNLINLNFYAKIIRPIIIVLS
jgi:hypothetical protein